MKKKIGSANILLKIHVAARQKLNPTLRQVTIKAGRAILRIDPKAILRIDIWAILRIDIWAILRIDPKAIL